MPAKSIAQKNWALGCLHNPSKMKGKCPPKRVAEEFTHFKGASKHQGWREAHRARHGIK